MFSPGLVSITFRQLTPEAIIQLVAQAGLAAIEWGGDVHVPPGDEAAARRVGRQTREAGLRVASYGSYFKAAQPGSEFAPVLASALALETPVIRVWAGAQGSAACSPAERQAVVAELRRAAVTAAQAGCRLSLEYHGGTLTDTLASTQQLLAECALPPTVLGCHWQPRTGMSPPEAAAELQALLPWLTHLHIFHWQSNYERLALADGAAAWQRYFAVAQSTGREHGALLEFVRADTPEQFLRDAATLLTLLPAGK